MKFYLHLLHSLNYELSAYSIRYIRECVSALYLVFTQFKHLSPTELLLFDCESAWKKQNITLNLDFWKRTLTVNKKHITFNKNKYKSKNKKIKRHVKVKVKVTLVKALRLCTGRKAHRGSRSTALLFHDHGTRRGWGVNVTLRPLFTPGKDPVLISV